MIVAMARIRVLGPRSALERSLEVLQDAGVFQPVIPAAAEPFLPVEPRPAERREERQLRRVVEVVEGAVERLPGGGGAAAPGEGDAVRSPSRSDAAAWARTARRVRRRSDALHERLRALEDERDLLQKYRSLLTSRLVRELAARPRDDESGERFSADLVLLRSSDPGAFDHLRAALEEALDGAVELRKHALPTGETVVLVFAPARRARDVQELLDRARLEEVPVPSGLGAESSPLEALPRMAGRLEEIPDEIRAARRELADVAAQHRGELASARLALRDRLARLEALGRARATERAFALEGWVPEAVLPALEDRLGRELGNTVVVERVGREEWAGEEAPVVLRNPRLLRPFERLTRVLPLPRYGSIDPTPFVAVFFPMFFGLILGDVGYGVMLAALALTVHLRSKPEGLARDVARIAGACALFTVVFGLLYGELFGDLGHRWLGLEPILFDRGEAILPFLGLALALGLVHLVLGLGLAVAQALRGERRRALGPGATAVMLLLVATALLVAARVLPSGFYTPVVIGLLIAFPVLVLAEGILAPLELLSTLGRILSYARVMALGVASVMLAVVANRMVGAVGSVLVGTLFALLFHLVNFAIGLFSPTIHALRLHYVEFFGTFYSPGGGRYEPLGHWRPRAAEPARPPEAKLH
ncbi:MAG: V-type ATP synthase subunit I [Thermoanaerobaculia bacterium]